MLNSGRVSIASADRTVFTDGVATTRSTVTAQSTIRTGSIVGTVIAADHQITFAVDEIVVCVFALDALLVILSAINAHRVNAFFDYSVFQISTLIGGQVV